MARRFDLRPIDAALIAALFAPAYHFLLRAQPLHSPLHLSLGVSFALLALLVLYLSVGTFRWLRSAHLTHNAVDGSNFRPQRRVGRKLPCPYPDAWYAVAHTEELRPGMVVPGASVTNAERGVG
jgi:hypothetical protein